jgi:hypothetical protein
MRLPASLLLIVLLLAGCEYFRVHGTASEHGFERFKVGVPL